MLNICFKYACAREKTVFLVKNKCIFSVLEIRFSFRGRPQGAPLHSECSWRRLDCSLMSVC